MGERNFGAPAGIMTADDLARLGMVFQIGGRPQDRVDADALADR